MSVHMDISGLKDLQRKLNNLRQNGFDEFCTACAKELAARLLAKAIKRTPVGQYPRKSGKKGGTLRRGWTAKTHAEAQSGSGKSSEAAGRQFAQSLEVQKSGGVFTVTIKNPVEYAQYVEYGHRTRKGGWVEGRFMLTISEQEVREITPALLERRLQRFLEERFDNN